MTPPKESSYFFFQNLTWYRDFLVAHGNMLLAPVLPNLNPVPSHVSLRDKTAIITGANSGIGLQLAIDLARLDATVYLACRSVKKAEVAIDHIASLVPTAKEEGRLQCLELDTSSFDSVRNFAKSWSGLRSQNGEGALAIDMLFHNAGIGQPPSSGKRFSPEGFELIYATNFLGPFLLTYLLESHLSCSARVIFTTSMGSLLSKFSNDFTAPGPVKERCEPGFHCSTNLQLPALLGGREILRDDDPSRYSATKAMQVIFATLLQRQFDNKKTLPNNGDGTNEDKVETPRQIAHAFSPGLTMTNFFSKLESDQLSWRKDAVFLAAKASERWGLISDVSQGAATGVWLATTMDDEVIKTGRGGYWERMAKRMNWGDVLDEEVLQRFWKRWESDAGIDWPISDNGVRSQPKQSRL